MTRSPSAAREPHRWTTLILLALVGAACPGGDEGSDGNAPPSPPESITAVATSATSIQVSWWGASDDSAVAGYRVIRNGAPYQDTTATLFNDVGLITGYLYCYRVLAYDDEGAESALSGEACATPTGTTYTLTVSKAGTGSGTVTSSPAGISCGTDCTEAYASGTTVTLTAAPAAGSTFGSWSGCTTTSGTTCTVGMTSAKTVTATFNLTPVTTYTLTVSKAGTGSGTVTSSPAGISCGTDCTEAYASGTTVTLTAAPAAGSMFGSWSGCTTTSGTTCTVGMTSAKTVTATFNVSAPQTVVLQATASNCALSNSLDSAVANTVYANCYPAVGINSYWNFLGGAWLAFAGAVKFNTAALAGKTIDSATLTLEARTIPVGYYRKGFKVGVFASTWSATSLTWNSMSGMLYYVDYWQSFAYPTYTGQKYNVNLKTAVQAWASGTFSNNGLGILSSDYTLPGNVDSLDEYDFWVPTLTVTYH